MWLRIKILSSVENGKCIMTDAHDLSIRFHLNLKLRNIEIRNNSMLNLKITYVKNEYYNYNFIT